MMENNEKAYGNSITEHIFELKYETFERLHRQVEAYMIWLDFRKLFKISPIFRQKGRFTSDVN